MILRRRIEQLRTARRNACKPEISPGSGQSYKPSWNSARVAERAIGERLRDHSAEDLEEQLALRDSLQALQRLAPKQAERKQESGEQNE
jgi:hypothetical protein